MGGGEAGGGGEHIEDFPSCSPTTITVSPPNVALRRALFFYKKKKKTKRVLAPRRGTQPNTSLGRSPQHPHSPCNPPQNPSQRVEIVPPPQPPPPGGGGGGVPPPPPPHEAPPRSTSGEGRKKRSLAGGAPPPPPNPTQHPRPFCFFCWALFFFAPWVCKCSRFAQADGSLDPRPALSA